MNTLQSNNFTNIHQLFQKTENLDYSKKTKSVKFKLITDEQNEKIKMII